MIKLGVVTISDRGFTGERAADPSGDAIVEIMQEAGASVARRIVVPDEREVIASTLKELATDCNVILTTGGTGIGHRDTTYEATKSVLEKELPGFGEIMRVKSFDVTPRSILSRATAGTLGKCLIVNLPGSPKAVRECLHWILPAIEHGVELLQKERIECAQDEA